MLDLLLSVALDPLKQCLEALLVLLSQFLHLSYEGHLEILVHDLCFKLFLLFDHIPHRVRFVIVLHREEYFLLLAHLNQILTVALLEQERFRNFLFMQDQLLLLFHLELLNQLKSRSLIVSHILVPCLRKFLKLELLSTFDIHKFFFLGETHVLFLALLLGARKLLKSQLHHFGPSIVPRCLCIDA